MAVTPDDYLARYLLGNAYMAIFRPAAAVQQYRAALAINPGFEAAAVALGRALQYTGDLAGAEQALREAMIRWSSPQAAYQLSLLKKFKQDDPDIEKFESLLARIDESDREGLAYVNFALAKAWEDAGDYDRAFAYLKTANDARRSLVSFDIDEQEATVERIINHFTAEYFAAHRSGCMARGPVFIVSMPRSGSTLVEQILSSHPQVVGGDELPSLQRVMLRWSAKLSPADRTPQAYLSALQRDATQLGEAYLEDARRYVGDSEYFTDKLPRNFQHLGTVRLILPEARVIHVMRDPIDTCLSIYKYNFGEAVGYAYDFGTLARYYRLYRRVMAHWKTVFPGWILDVRYEDLVTDPVSQVRRILEFCGLPWNENCLKFHETNRSVSTLSATQVRQPLYSSAVQRWRKYERHLGPLIEALGPYREWN